MQIDPTILSEKNYTGTRLVEVNDPKVKELKEKLKRMQLEEVNPILDSTEPLLKVLDPYYSKMQEIREKIKPILEKAKPLQEEYEKYLITHKIPETPETELMKKIQEQIIKLQEQYQEEASKNTPKVPELDALADKMKIYIDQVRELEGQIQEIKKEMQPTKEKYESEMKKVEIIDQRAQLIKSKLVPLINKHIENHLGEFEKALQVIDKDEKIFVEIVDELEEKIKQLREAKIKNEKPR